MALAAARPLLPMLLRALLAAPSLFRGADGQLYTMRGGSETQACYRCLPSATLRRVKPRPPFPDKSRRNGFLQ